MSKWNMQIHRKNTRVSETKWLAVLLLRAYAFISTVSMFQSVNILLKSQSTSETGHKSDA